MAQNMRDIKRKLKSIQNMRQITKAMEMVAAARLRKSQQLAEAARPYADKIREVLGHVVAAGRDTGLNHPMLETRPINRTGYLVITSDRGLAGGLNANLLRKLVKAIQEKHSSPDEYRIFVIGRQGRDFLRRRGIPITAEIIGLDDSPEYADIKPIASKAIQSFVDGEYDELYLVYNVFKNALVQIPTIKRLLPLDAIEHEGPVLEYIYEPSAEAVLDVLLPKYAETLIYSAVLENKASEFGARMTAMGNATKNADKLIQTNTLAFNRARQAAITQEISEIVGGANALG